MIFQEPMTSLNPVLTCGFQLIEPSGFISRDCRSGSGKSDLLFTKVRLPILPGHERYPHQLSGGKNNGYDRNGDELQPCIVNCR